MGNSQSIKRRIKSVASTEQITKAMEMVAASKMRKAQDATIRSRAYTLSIREIMSRLTHMNSDMTHALLAVRPVKNVLVMLISSDRGLAGAYNNNLFKRFLTSLKQYQANAWNIHAIVIGQKGTNFAKKLEGITLAGVYTNWPTEPTSRDVWPLVTTLVDGFSAGTYDQVDVISTDFISTIKQAVAQRTILPINPTALDIPEDQISDTVREAMFEPTPQDVFDFLLPRLVESELYQASLDAIASEQSMRMMAMQNASENASEIIDDLTLLYNSARQAAITQELAEITAGAQAIT